MSKETKTVVQQKGLGLTSILTLIFVVAKLLGVIDWSWWLVFAPTLIGVGIGLTILLGCLMVVIIAAISDK